MSTSPLLQWSESQKTAILAEFGRTAESLIQDRESIKTWMAKQPHLPEISDDVIIECFILMNKFRIEKAKKKLDMYYTVRNMIPEFYDKNPNGPEVQKVMNMMYFIPLPQLTKELLRVVIFKIKDITSEFDSTTYIAHTYNVSEVRLREDYNSGEVHIYDLSGLKFNILTKFTPSLLKKSSFVLEKVFSNRAQAIHFINAPTFVDSFISLIKSFMNSKLSSRVFSHRDIESLYKLVPKNILPADYGGEERSLEELSDEWKKAFLKYDDLFQHLRGLKVNEKLRQDKLSNEDTLELQGNFRQLVVD